MEIDASPTKSFLVDTITKDINLIEAVLDLIDNSIDSLIMQDIESKGTISIVFEKGKFVFEDFCGGINKADVYERVFRFGKPKRSKRRTIGVYGIGMKRAVFKIGKNILIQSDDGTDYFSILIDDKWLRDENNWKLKFHSESESKGKQFTRLTVTDLYPNIENEVLTNHFQNALKEKIQRTYTHFLNKKVNITVNGILIEPIQFEFLHDGKDFIPFHKNISYEDVEIELFAGFCTNGSLEDRTYGWYVFCNDRLILSKDTSSSTGWGAPPINKTFHYPEDARFLGLIFFRSDNPESLPWQSTKDQIQLDSRIYRQAQIEMKNITNKFIEVIRIAGRVAHEDTGEPIRKTLFLEVESTPIDELIEESEGMVPEIEGKKLSELVTSVRTWTSIQYTKKISLVKKVKEKLDNPYMSNKEVGRKTFEYYVDLEEIEDE